MRYQRVFVDANVLYSRTLRDWLLLLRIETRGMFQVHTTEDVLAETEYRLRRNNPTMAGGVITDLRRKIVATMDEIVDDFDAAIPFLGSDPHDRHIHAAAVESRADILLTEDRAFVTTDGDPYEVFTCDEFFVLVEDSAGRMVERVVKDQAAYWQGRLGPRRSLADSLRHAGCPVFAERVEVHLRALSGASTAGSRGMRRQSVTGSRDLSEE